MRDELFAEGKFSLGLLFASLGILLSLVLAALDGLHVGEDKLGIDHLDVRHGVDAAADMRDVAIFKAAHDVDDGIDLADMAEELVPEALTLAGTLHEACDVHELDRGGHQL